MTTGRGAIERLLTRRLICTSSIRYQQHFQNAAGIYHLQTDLQRDAFGRRPSTLANNDAGKTDFVTAKLHETALKHLERNNLLNQETMKPQNLQIELPQLLGQSDLDEHFQKIGHQMSQPYLQWCKDYIQQNNEINLRAQQQQQQQQQEQKRPPLGMRFDRLLSSHNFVPRSGWVRYEPGKPPQSVEYPRENVITFDTEVLFKVHLYPVMATAVAGDVIYVWLSPWLLNETENHEHLVPLGSHQQVVIGHYVGFDRKLVKEEYNIDASPKWFMDTMGFHIAINGMCGQQRATYLKYEKLVDQIHENPKDSTAKRSLIALLQQEPWVRYTSNNSLASVVKFHLGEKMNKEDRNYFAEATKAEIAEPELLDRLIKYCAKDSLYAQEVFSHVLPRFLELNPHPVSFGALRGISSLFLPINDSWTTYKETAEAYFLDAQENINQKLRELAEEAASYVEDPEMMREIPNDPWLNQLDWTVAPIKYTKGTKKEPPRPVKRQKFPGKPNWYKELFKSAASDAMKLSARSRTAILLLRLKWDEYPLVWFDKHGWCIWVPKHQKRHYEGLNFPYVSTDPNNANRCLFKLPHPDGESARCTSPLAKFYIQFFDDGSLKSDKKLAMEAINMNIECSYWISCRQRVNEQFPVFQSDAVDMGMPRDWGMILPKMVPTGAVTRRAVEDTWLTASNAKSDRIGSELKINVKAPPGYKIVGADVDSEELWIASVVGDSLLKMHGGTAVGWMTLEGTKKAGTDLHSKSAQILGISRNAAKVFNYGRIYGAGKKSAARTLRQFNPAVSVKEADEKAAELYASTKGLRSFCEQFPLPRYWRGGTESVVYNQLELLANQPRQRTPVLGAGISDALSSNHLNAGKSYLTTRTNWTIQSSGVDYLHLLIAGMHYLCDVYKIKARLLLTVHDEVRFLVPDDDAYRAGFALQVANLWTRAMFCQQLGFDNLPASVAFFSSVDFDHMLRKEVDDPCLTPTQPDEMQNGEALSMPELAAKCSTLGAIDKDQRTLYEQQPFEARKPVMAGLNETPLLLEYVQAQLGTASEAKIVEQSLKKKSEPIMSKNNFDFPEFTVTSYHKDARVQYQKVYVPPQYSRAHSSKS